MIDLRPEVFNALRPELLKLQQTLQNEQPATRLELEDPIELEEDRWSWGTIRLKPAGHAFDKVRQGACGAGAERA